MPVAVFAQATSSAMSRARSVEVVPVARASSDKRTLISAMRYADIFDEEERTSAGSPPCATVASTSEPTSS